MAIPDYQTLMLPLLQIASDGQEHSLGEVYEILAEHFGLSEAEQRELLPSGRKTVFHDRVGWARTYLIKAGLLLSTGRGRFCITQRGADVLSSNPSRIDHKFLERFPEFVAFKNTTRLTKRSAISEREVSQTPEELLESGYQELRGRLAHDLLERVKSMPPSFFEQLVVDLLVAMGYGGSREDAGQAIGRSGDGGIDGIIKEDKLGLDVIYIQAKRWEGPVGRPVVQAFAGSLEGHRAKKGVLITTSHFTQEALDYVHRIEKRIILIDGDRLVDLMIDHGIGVTDLATYTVKKIDLDYFGED